MRRRNQPLPAFAGAATLAVVVALLGACASAGERLSAQQLAGCYYFERNDVARELNLPWGVRLTEDSLQGWPAMAARHALRAATLSTEGDQDHPFGYWLTIDSDSVEIGYPAGGSLVVRVAPDGQRMVGTVRALGDAVPPPGVARAATAQPVMLQHALCPEQ